MAELAPAFMRMMGNEGGYVLTNIKGDRGGQTYAGISRNAWPEWSGWQTVDAGRDPSKEEVETFYRRHFWNRIHGDKIESQHVAETLFDFAVNVGARKAIQIAQRVLCVTDDGIIGPITLGALNRMEPELFAAQYTVAKIRYYADIVSRNRSQIKFLLGWILRALREA